MIDCEHSDPGGDEGHDEIFVERVEFSEDGQVEEHDGEKFAGFGEDEGDVVDVGEGGVAEGGGERGGYGDENEGEKDGSGGEYGGCGRGGGRGEEEVGVACEGGEGGLDGIEEDGVGETFGGEGGSVGGGGYAFLEEGPGETGMC